MSRDTALGGFRIQPTTTLLKANSGKCWEHATTTPFTDKRPQYIIYGKEKFPSPNSQLRYLFPFNYAQVIIDY